MVSVKAAATGKVSWGPMVIGLGPLEHPAGQAQTSSLHNFFFILMFSYQFCTEDRGAFNRRTFTPQTSGTSGPTHLQKLNKTCHGQTIPEAVTPLNVQTHEAQKRTVKDTMSDRQ